MPEIAIPKTADAARSYENTQWVKMHLVIKDMRVTASEKGLGTEGGAIYHMHIPRTWRCEECIRKDEYTWSVLQGQDVYFSWSRFPL